MFCVLGLVFGGTEGVGSRSCFCAPRLVFGGTKGVGSLFDVLRSRTRFRLYRGRRLPFSYFVRPDSFSVVLRASGSVFMFCALGLVFGGTEGVGSRFRVLRARTCFRQNRGRPIPFSCFPLPDMFCAVTRASGPFLCFALLDLFFTVPRASHPVIMFSVPGHVFGGNEGVGSLLMFCAPRLVFDGTEGVGSRFHVLCSRPHFRWY
jgi:hypothetical protein